MELSQVPAEAQANPERNRVHVGSQEFRHLEKYNMNEICARVTVVGTKPGPKK